MKSKTPRVKRDAHCEREEKHGPKEGPNKRPRHAQSYCPACFVSAKEKILTRKPVKGEAAQDPHRTQGPVALHGSRPGDGEGDEQHCGDVRPLDSGSLKYSRS